MPEPRRKRKPWEIDLTIFESGPKPSLIERRIIGPLKLLGKYSLFALAFSYPSIIVLVGVVYGGLVFWAAFAGSAALIVLLISKMGFARNFATSNVNVKKRFAGLFIAFPAVLGFYYGLIYLRIWFIPVAIAVLVLLSVLGLRKTST